MSFRRISSVGAWRRMDSCFRMNGGGFIAAQLPVIAGCKDTWIIS